MIEAAQTMIRINNSQEEEPEITINPATQKHFELQIKTLQDAPRDEDRLREELLKLKEKENEQKKQITLKTLKGWLQRLKC